MPSPSDPLVTTLARLHGDARMARRLADALAEILASDDTAVAAVDGGAAAGWSVEVHFAQAPDEAALRTLVAEIAGPAAAEALTFERIASRDWVASSLAGLKPVAAGRF